MIRQTSADVYHTIEREGLLSRLRFEVYSVLYQFGPMTQGELWSEYFPERQRHTVCPRFAELCDRGVIAHTGVKPCRYSGKISMVWDVTENLPLTDSQLERRRLSLQIEALTKKLNRVKRKYEALTGAVYHEDPAILGAGLDL